ASGRGVRVAVAELAVQPLARLTNKAEQRMPGDLAGVGAARTLPRAGWPVVLDQRRVEIERHRLPLEQRMHARKQLLDRPLELADVAGVEAGTDTAQSRRIGDRM